MGERQWGVVSRAQLLDLGLSPPAIATWRRRRRLQVIYRGVYAVGHAALRVEGRRLAAVLACGPGAVLSHMSAAAHWGLLRSDQTRIDVTAARGRHGAPGIRLHRSRSLDAQDTAYHQGLPITTVHRTLLDLAATARPSELERALAQAERLRLYDHRAITGILVRANGAPADPDPDASDQPHAQVDPERMGSRVPAAAARRRPPGAAHQRGLPRPRPRPLRARLPLAHPAGHRRDRRLRDPRHPRRLPPRPRQGRRPARLGLPRPQVHPRRRPRPRDQTPPHAARVTQRRARAR